MKKISLISMVFIFSANAACAQKQVLNSRTASRSVQATTQQSVQATIQQPAQTTKQQPAKYSTVEQASSQLRNIYPIPKKILLLTKIKSLSLMAEQISPMKTMDNTIKKNSSSNNSTYRNQNSRMVESGILGMTTKNFSNGPKVSFALTNNTTSWASNPSYSIRAKSSNNDNSDPSWNCTVTNQSVNAQSTTFMNASKNEQGNHLYPGAIYTFDDYASGNFKAYENGLNPLEVYTNTQVGVNSFTVQSPTAPSIRQAISNIIGQFNPSQGGATVLQQTLYTDNLTDLSIAISAGGAYDGYSGSDSYSHNQSEHHIYITLDAIKSLYTISVHRPANGYFANGQMPNTNSPIVMVQDVTYGARLLANIDITITSNTDMNKFQFAYNAIAANGFVNVDALAHDASIAYKINAYMVGVPTSTGIITTLQNFQQQLNNIFSQSNYRNAVPIQYSLTDLDGNYLGVESMTDQFTVRNCTPAQDKYTLKSAFFSLRSGADGKNDDSQFILTMGMDGGNSIKNGIGMFSDNQTEYKSGSSLPAQPIVININPNHPNDYTLDDFKNGGYVDFNLSCAANLFKSDDWDIAGGQLTFNFVSQKGNPPPFSTIVQIPNFRLSSSTNGFTTGNQTVWFGPDFKPR